MSGREPCAQRGDGLRHAGPMEGDTIYLCARDENGMAVSLNQSLSEAFGSGVMVPGTGVLLHNRAAGNFTLQVALCVCILGVCLASFLIFTLSAHGAKWLNPIFLRLTSRLMGLLLAAIAMQFLIKALTDLKLVTVPGETMQ